MKRSANLFVERFYYYNVIIKIPKIVSTIPVTLFKTIGLALLANLDAKNENIVVDIAHDKST